VLPFVNMSGDPEQEYFSDGITEDIITDLSKVSALEVVSRNGSFLYKGKQVDVPKVARELKVTHVLEGSVRRAGGRVRITAQLIDGASNRHLWAERYDRDASDIFELQDEISHAIVKALKLRLLPEEKKAIERLRNALQLRVRFVRLPARQGCRAGHTGTLVSKDHRRTFALPAGRSRLRFPARRSTLPCNGRGGRGAPRHGEDPCRAGESNCLIAAPVSCTPGYLSSSFRRRLESIFLRQDQDGSRHAPE
jgi:TolB-like protein